MTRFHLSSTLIIFFAWGLAAALFLSSGVSLAISIVVPPKDKLLSEANTILVCKVSIKDGVPVAKITEVLKGKQDLIGKTVEVSSPFSEMSFPLQKWIKEAGDTEVILLGIMPEDNPKLTLTWGSASFWPRGAPVDISKGKQFVECKQVVVDHQNKTSTEKQ